jgi:hypothetical protein
LSLEAADAACIAVRRREGVRDPEVLPAANVWTRAGVEIPLVASRSLSDRTEENELTRSARGRGETTP